MRNLVAPFLLCSAGLALALDNTTGSPGTATPQPYENPPIRPLPAPVTGPSQTPPLLPELPPAQRNVPPSQVPGIEREERRVRDTEERPQR